MLSTRAEIDCASLVYRTHKIYAEMENSQRIQWPHILKMTMAERIDVSAGE